MTPSALMAEEQGAPVLESLHIQAVISRLGAGKAYLLLDGKIEKRIIDGFVFKQWQEILASAHYAEDDVLKRTACTKLREKAVSFQERAIAYSCEHNIAQAEAMLSNMLAIGTSLNWLNLYATMYEFERIYVVPERMKVLAKTAEDIIRQTVVNK